MSNVWAPVVAALGASLLTGGFGFGVVWWQAQQAKKSALPERRSRAYSMLLVQSASVMHMARGIHVTMEYRSGLREGLNVLSGKYKALDPLELARWQITEMQPLWEAWSEVWAVGSEEAIAEANDLINKRGEVIGAGAQRGQGRPMWLQALAGEKWTPEQLDQWQAEERALAVSRKRFGEIARKELGVEAVNLFVSTELGVPPTGASQSADNKMP